MKLVRDLDSESFKIYLYFEQQGERISPAFSNVELATEWYAKFRMSQYAGAERRSTHLDRRRLSQNRPFESRMFGRREVDRELPFEDRAKWTLREIRALTQNLS